MNTNTAEVSFDCSAKDEAVVTEIVTRAKLMARKGGLPFDALGLRMDIIAVHANGCPLDLEKLLAFDDANFAHDIYGIGRHLDRSTGWLGAFFDPRCSLPQAC